MTIKKTRDEPRLREVAIRAISRNGRHAVARTPSSLVPRFSIIRDRERCIACQVCVRQCSFDAQAYDGEENEVYGIDANCVGCQRCVAFCPTSALTVTDRKSVV